MASPLTLFFWTVHPSIRRTRPSSTSAPTSLHRPVNPPATNLHYTTPRLYPDIGTSSAKPQVGHIHPANSGLGLNIAPRSYFVYYRSGCVPQCTQPGPRTPSSPCSHILGNLSFQISFISGLWSFLWTATYARVEQWFFHDVSVSCPNAARLHANGLDARSVVPNPLNVHRPEV